jgi:hypothetical protein
MSFGARIPLRGPLRSANLSLLRKNRKKAKFRQSPFFSSLLAEQLTVETDADATVLKLTRQVSAKIGLDWSRAMAAHLAPALKADCVFVGEFTPGSVQRVTTLAACLEGEQASLTFD